MSAVSIISNALLEAAKTRLTSVRTLFRQREEIYRDANEGRQFNLLYLAMLVFACLIALLGLLLNSPAVIIGAMLISPLMGPILSCGLALTLADWDLGGKAGKNALLSVGETILIAALATWLSPLKDATPEILARTTPNLMDLLIAFFSGIAGTLALSSRKSGLTILPGVAIATAVMPPLATVGYGLSTRQWSVAGGAFMLFITNFTAIVISADLVFLLIGFRPKQVQITREHTLFVKWRIAIAGAVLLALSIPLLRTLLRASQQARIRREIAVVLHEQFDRPGQRRVASTDINTGQDPIVIDSAVQTERFIEPREINAAETAISTKLRTPVRLIVEQLQLAHQVPSSQSRSIVGGNDFVGGGVVRPGGGPEFAESASDALSRMQDRVRSVLDPLLNPIGVSEIKVNGLGVEPGGKVRVTLSGRESSTTDDQGWKVSAVALGKELKASVRIVAVLELEDVAAYDVHFLKGSSHLTSAELRRAARFLSPWKNEAAIRFSLVVSPAALPELADRRLAFLRQRFSVENVAVAGPDVALGEDVVRMQLVQVINADPNGSKLAGKKPGSGIRDDQRP